MNEATAERFDIPACGLKQSVHNLEILYKGATGESCPRCEGNEFGKLGYYDYKGKRYPKKICHSCGYAFSIVDFKNEGSTRHRAARILNLDDKKVDNLIDAALQFGLIKENDNKTYNCNYTSTALKKVSKAELYHKVPLYHYLIETVGYNLKRSVFENALKSHPDKTLATESKIKRDTLWRRYQEIAIEIFVCESTCKFSRTCKKEPREREECDVVQKSRPKKELWKVDIEI
jgi:hypothetical protein